jgi:hypothetical protein
VDSASFLEKEMLERGRLKALELIEQAKVELAAEKPKGREAIAAEKPDDHLDGVWGTREDVTGQRPAKIAGA